MAALLANCALTHTHRCLQRRAYIMHTTNLFVQLKILPSALGSTINIRLVDNSHSLQYSNISTNCNNSKNYEYKC